MALFLRLVLLVAAVVAPALPCSCGRPKPACAYLSADVIFLGRVTFTNDDPRAGANQLTLVRFEIEESFYGTDRGVREVWIDPGNSTSCYADYRIGKQYVVFASKTVAPETGYDLLGNKPAPPGFDPAHPPAIYSANLCSGTRLADPGPVLDGDLAALRSYRAGAVPPRILGHVVLTPFSGWPQLTGPGLGGARLTIRSEMLTLHAIADEHGEFSIEQAPAGYYEVVAEFSPLKPSGRTIIGVPEKGCGYVDVPLSSASTIEGVVLDHRGRPARNVHVSAESVDNLWGDYDLYGNTDRSGRFRIAGVPEYPIIIATGGKPDTATVYYPRGHDRAGAEVLRLKPGERRAALTLRLEPPLPKSVIPVRVVQKDGRPVVKADVQLWGPKGDSGDATTDSRGLATVRCVKGFAYRLEVIVRPRELGSPAPPEVSVACDGSTDRKTIIVDVPTPTPLHGTNSAPAGPIPRA